MTDSTPLDRAARAIAGNHGYDFDQIDEAERNAWREDARAALDASGNDELVEALKELSGLASNLIAAVLSKDARQMLIAANAVNNALPKCNAIALTQEPEQ